MDGFKDALPTRLKIPAKHGKKDGKGQIPNFADQTIQAREGSAGYTPRLLPLALLPDTQQVNDSKIGERQQGGRKWGRRVVHRGHGGMRA